MTILREPEATVRTSVEIPDRTIAIELVRAGEAAAIAASSWIGTGRKNDADGAAVDAMRRLLGTVHFDGHVVIGEGEKDEAPMLWAGEPVGDGYGAAYDIAVDPIDGTSLVAAGRPGALAVIAASDRGTMFDASAVFYMDKIVCGPIGRGIVDIRVPIGDNVRALAAAKGVSVEEICVAVLDRPRHENLIADVRSSGARVRLMLDGDVAGGVNAAGVSSQVDLCVGIGGAPEGIITACAVRALGGLMQAKLAPSGEAQRRRAMDAGHELSRILELDDLVRGDNTCFIATGVTDGDLVGGVQRDGTRVRTESIVLRSVSGSARRIIATHRADPRGRAGSTHSDRDQPRP